LWWCWYITSRPRFPTLLCVYMFRSCAPTVEIGEDGKW
jgi:hypothetical protein